MNLIDVNPGDGKPFLSLTILDERGLNQANMVLRVTPAQLRALADDLERLSAPPRCPVLEQAS